MHGYLVDCTYLRHYRTQGLELSALMLEAAAHNPSLFGAGSAFARDTLAPVVAAVLRFFYEHYEVNLAGEMVMRAQALETWQECTNPTTDIAGLQWVVHKVLELPDGLVPARDLGMIRALKAQLLPVTKVIRVDAPVPGGAKRQRQMRYLSHCQWVTIEQNDNVENVALYAVHPFPLFGRNFTHELPFANGTAGCGGRNLDVATNTYARRLFHNPINASAANGGPSIGEWQEGPQAARLGMADEAAAAVQLRAGWAGTGTGPYNRSHDGVSDHQMRFPGFFGRLASDENYFPDPEHLATMRTTLQWQILQNDGHRILLFGALPRHGMWSSSCTPDTTPSWRASVWTGDLCTCMWSRRRDGRMS